MSLSFLVILLYFQKLNGLNVPAASTVLNTFRAVQFLPDWTNSVYKTQLMSRPSLSSCASNCIKELNGKCSFFYFDSKNLFSWKSFSKYLWISTPGSAKYFTY